MTVCYLNLIKNRVVGQKNKSVYTIRIAQVYSFLKCIFSKTIISTYRYAIM